jgi:hypothetical protein
MGYYWCAIKNRNRSGEIGDIMAIIKHVQTLAADVSVTFYYDDVAMKMTKIDAVNNSKDKKTLRTKVDKAKPIDLKVDKELSSSIDISEADKPTYTVSTSSKDIGVKKDIDQFNGITWSVSYGV